MSDAPALSHRRPVAAGRAVVPPWSPEWLRPAVGAIVLALGALTIVTMHLDHGMRAMPDSHLQAVPVAVAVFTVVWMVDLAGFRLPRLVFAAAIVLPSAWLAIIGHLGPNFLFLFLLVAWVVFTGTRAEGLATLGLALATITVGALQEGAVTGRIATTGGSSWIVGLLAIWAMSRLLVDQQRLVSALRGAQAELTGQAAENERLRAEAEQRARELEAAHEQAQQAAALEERQRLARELHDAVTQTLFSATLTAEVLPRLWKESPAEAEAQLEELRQLTRGALAEMRALLLELRPAGLIETPLGVLLKQLGAAFTGRARVPAELRVEGDRVLPPEVQTALYRLAQEALNNVAKHADASRVEVALACTPERVELRIADDGRGFDVGGARPGHFGLGIMRERAQAIGATVAVESAPGRGTTVTAVWEDDRSRRS